MAERQSSDESSDWFEQHPPTYLYRYIPMRSQSDRDRAEAVITGGRLRLSSPEWFNDPFDCLPIGEVPESRVGRELLLRGAMKRVAGRGPMGVAEDRIRLFINSPTAMKEELEASFRSTAIKAGVACFSENPDTVLMWSHYADNHRGAVLRFRMDRWPITELPLLLKVDYSPERPVIRLRNQVGDNGDLILGLTRKADFWAYEGEWRLIVKNGAGDTVRVPTSCLNGVIMGAAMPVDQRSMIMSWAGERASALEVLRAEICRREFRLRIVAA